MGNTDHGAREMAGDLNPNVGGPVGEEQPNAAAPAEVPNAAAPAADNENQNEDDEQEFVEPQHPPIPVAPTREEWLKHQVTHMPFKSWCPICIKNAEANNPHKLTHHFRGVAMFCMDYMYMTKKPDEEQLMHPILVIK